MADIRIEKKKPIWPWVVALVIILIAVFLYLYGSMDTETTDELDETEMEEVTYVRSNEMILENEGEFN